MTQPKQGENLVEKKANREKGRTKGERKIKF